MPYDLFTPEVTVGPVLIGCAGWSVPSAASEYFPESGTHLERFSRIFSAVEINTSFYRPHRPETYARWRDSVPDGFQFSVKVPRTITHHARLRRPEDALKRFVDEAGHLGRKLGCLLVQLPPSLKYEVEAADPFFELLRSQTGAAIVCEPRHPTWFAEKAAKMLARHGVGYVLADPPVAAPIRQAADPGIVYIRLHGSPVMYHSAYSDEFLDRLAQDIDTRVQAGQRVWCVFDNTASGAAVPNALSLLQRIRR